MISYVTFKSLSAESLCLAGKVFGVVDARTEILRF